MPRGYRRYLLAIVGCLILAGANQPNQRTNKHDAPNRAGTADLTEPPFRPYPDRYSENCYKADNHDTSELCAEWRAAISGEKAAREAHRATNWAIVATLLSLIGVAGLIWTIWQTSGSLKEARRANRIAMKANARATRQAIAGGEDTKAALRFAETNAHSAAELVRVSHENAIRELRAYVDFESVRLKSLHNDSDGKVWIAFDISLRNFGKTTAEQIEIFITYTFVRESGQTVYVKQNHKDGLGGISPSDVLNWKDIWGLEEAAWEDMRKKAITVQLNISVTYLDAFAVTRTLRSLYETDGINSVVGFRPGTRSNT